MDATAFLPGGFDADKSSMWPGSIIFSFHAFLSNCYTLSFFVFFGDCGGARRKSC